MKERPILFSAPMVRAILAGTKTQTRRPMKLRDLLKFQRGDAAHYRGVSIEPTLRRAIDDVGVDGVTKLCPYGQPGDRLWVRENGWERPDRTPRMMREGADTWAPYYYDADRLTEQDRDDFKAWGFKRRPSIHMPRWASRILLEVVSVRIERLQDISEADARAEGICELPGQAAEPGSWWTADVDAGAALHGRSPSTAYRLLWKQINGPESWAANPWVWVIEFKRVSE